MMEQTKAELRKQYKQKRRALTPEQVTAASAQIRKRFMNSDEYKDCNHLLIYVSQDNEVDTIETVGGTDIEKMESGDWDLTLFTCTTGGKARAAVRCKEK